MRKRLRKKLRVAEFEEVLLPIAFDLPDDAPRAALDDVCDRFIELIESQGLAFGGGGHTRWSGIAESAERWSHPTAEQASEVRKWLATHPLVLRSWVGDPMKATELDRQIAYDPDFPTVDGPKTQ